MNDLVGLGVVEGPSTFGNCLRKKTPSTEGATSPPILLDHTSNISLQWNNVRQLSATSYMTVWLVKFNLMARCRIWALVALMQLLQVRS